jgi:hypothetical protein
VLLWRSSAYLASPCVVVTLLIDDHVEFGMRNPSLSSWQATKSPSLCFCVAAYLMLSFPLVKADEVLLTLDLRNDFHDDAMGGGTWQLFWARLREAMRGSFI